MDGVDGVERVNSEMVGGGWECVPSEFRRNLEIWRRQGLKKAVAGQAGGRARANWLEWGHDGGGTEATTRELDGGWRPRQARRQGLGNRQAATSSSRAGDMPRARQPLSDSEKWRLFV